MVVAWIALLAALLLIVAPLVAAIVLAVRGRPGAGAIVGGVGVGLGALLAMGSLISVRTEHRGPAEVHAVWDRDGARREAVLHAYGDDDDARLQSRFAHDNRVHVRPDGVHVDERGGEILIAPAPGRGPEGDAWRDAAGRHEERLLQRRRHDRDHRPQALHHGPGGPLVEAEFVSENELPEWAQTPPADRLVVTGPLVTDEDGGPAAARRAAEEATTARLIEQAGLPPGAAINPDDVPRPGRIAVQTLTRTTGENAFTMYRAFVQVDASAPVLDRLRQGHRHRLGRDRALWAVGGAGACVVGFAGLWGLGRRKLRAPTPGEG
ncbi:hypothetical protein [Alienimonas californiensis]|uniref:Uncharacterized protein n=1 Tax=Alienimonas californiensis TaxID=2527989 RepID=A0A517P798_9PLAN|nr:hypothetical protein [Alienimonas californiensis]QDT15256.1 hypothetical protein CA12_13390 [Alienimonas californiensis]